MLEKLFKKVVTNEVIAFYDAYDALGVVHQRFCWESKKIKCNNVRSHPYIFLMSLMYDSKLRLEVNIFGK